MSEPDPTHIWTRAVADLAFRDALIEDPLRALAEAGDVRASPEQVQQLEEMDRDERAGDGDRDRAPGAFAGISGAIRPPSRRRAVGRTRRVSRVPRMADPGWGEKGVTTIRPGLALGAAAGVLAAIAPRWDLVEGPRATPPE